MTKDKISDRISNFIYDISYRLKSKILMKYISVIAYFRGYRKYPKTIEKYEIDDSVNVLIVYNNDAVNKADSIFSYTKKIFDDNISYVIFVDKYTCGAPMYVRNFIIAHEIGHIINDTIVNRCTYDERLEYIINDKVAPEELVADQYAFDTLGDYESHKAFHYLLNLVNVFTPNGYEILLRSEYIY